MSARKDVIKLKIDLPFFKVELRGSPEQHLSELRKLISELGRVSLTQFESEAFDELMPAVSSALPVWKLSKELQKNTKLINSLTQFSQVEDGVMVKKASIENMSEVSESKMLSRVSISEIKKALSKIFFDVDTKKVSFVLAHAMGGLSDEDFAVIFDQVKKALPYSKVDILKTKKDLMGKTLIECVMLGSFPEERFE
jgi:hypothetical protein